MKFTKKQRDAATKAIEAWRMECQNFEEDTWNEMVSGFLLVFEDMTEEQAEDLANGRWT